MIEQAKSRTAQRDKASDLDSGLKLSSPGFLCLLLAVITCAVYLPVGRYDFVNYDDLDYVTANPHVQSGLKWQNVIWAFTTGHASNWHPLTWLSHMLDCQLFGQHAGTHHLVNVFFHSVNTLLLFLVLRRMTGALWRSALVAALFALHPLHVESVAWIAERKDVLSAFFFLLTLGAYMQCVEQSKAGGRESNTLHASRFYALTLLLFSLGLMSKPMLVTVPFVLLLLDYWPLGRFQPSNLEIQPSIVPQLKTQNPKLKTLQPLLIEKIPFFALSLISSLITFAVQKKGGAVSTSISMGARVENALVSYVRYLGKMFWPENLSVLYPHPGHWPPSQVIGCGVLLALITAAVIALGRARPWLAVGWLWFLGMMVPVIGLVQVGIQSMADRYTYLTLIGLFIMLVWGIAEAIRNLPRLKEALAVAGGLSVAIYVFLTSFQVRHWRNSETLFRHAVEATKNNYLAYNNLGFYLSNQGRVQEAMENYRKSLEIEPNYEDAQNNLGYALAGQKKYAEAIEHYHAALRVKPNHTEVHNNLGNALSEIGQIDEAITHYWIVLQQKPDHADAHNNLGIALAMQGKLAEAIPHFQDAIRYKPNYASAHSNLGNAWAVQHKFDEAIKEYLQSLRLKPDDAQAHNNLGNVLAEQGRLDEAIAQYNEALRLNADNPEAHYNLGLALARQGKREQAAAHYTEALRLKPDYGEARKQLNAISGQSAP